MEVSLAEGIFRRLDSAAALIGPIGRGVAWLTLLMVLLTFGIVILRYGMNQGWIWLQESVTYLHAFVFMTAIAWTFQIDDHVRVDIFYRDRSSRHKAWVNLLGTLIFLIPFSIFLIVIGWNGHGKKYLLARDRRSEKSRLSRS